MRDETVDVPPRPKNPASTARRPVEPFRPVPARRRGVTLLAAQARRARFRVDSR